MFSEMVIKLYYFSLLTLQTKSITYELVGQNLYILQKRLCIIRVCNQLFLKLISKNQIVYWHLYAYADDDKLLVSAFK